MTPSPANSFQAVAQDKARKKNPEWMVGCYYIPPVEDDVATVVGETRACLAGSGERLLEPAILKVHSPPFEQQLAPTEKLTNNITGKSLPIPRKAWMVFVRDRKDAVFLVRWYETSCFENFEAAVKERNERFEFMVLLYARETFGITDKRNVINGKGLAAHMARYHEIVDARLALSQRNKQVVSPYQPDEPMHSAPKTVGKFHPFKKR